MAASNQVRVSEAVMNNRFSAEFFDPRYVFRPQSGYDWRPIGRLLTKCEYGLSIAMNSTGRGFPIYRMNEIEDCFLKRPAKCANIPKSLFEAYRLRENDVLFNRTNSFEFVGRTGLVKDQTDCTFASYLIRLVPDESVLLPEFLAIYLNTPFGIGQVKRRAMRSINQANVSGSEIKKVLIPVFDISVQNEIAVSVNAAFQRLESSRAYYLSAEKMIRTELGLDLLKIHKPIGYTTRLSQVESSRRLDSEHFYPAFHDLIHRLPKQVSLVKLGTYLSFCQRGKQPYYAKSGLRVVNSKHVQPNRVVFKGNRYALPNSGTDLQIRTGDLLINGTGRGTLGRAAAYLESDRALPDNHVTILRTSKLDPVYLAFFLNSVMGQLQVEMHQRGTSGQLELYPMDIRKMLVWDAPDEIQREIRRLHDDGRAAEISAKQSLMLAKSRVAALVEEAVQK